MDRMGREQRAFTSVLALAGLLIGALSSGCLVCSGSSPADGNGSSCDPDPGGGTGGTDGSGGLSQGGMASGGGGNSGVPVTSCNELEVRSDAPRVTVTSSEDAAPAPTGGKIGNGTYFYTTQKIYEAAAAAPGTLPRTQVTISGDSWQEAIGYDSSVSHFTRRLTTSDSTFTLTSTCPVRGNVETGTYTATDTSLTLYFEGGLHTIARVFARQ